MKYKLYTKGIEKSLSHALFKNEWKGPYLKIESVFMERFFFEGNLVGHRFIRLTEIKTSFENEDGKNLVIFTPEPDTLNEFNLDGKEVDSSDIISVDEKIFERKIRLKRSYFQAHAIINASINEEKVIVKF